MHGHHVGRWTSARNARDGKCDRTLRALISSEELVVFRDDRVHFMLISSLAFNGWSSSKSIMDLFSFSTSATSCWLNYPVDASPPFSRRQQRTRRNKCRDWILQSWEKILHSSSSKRPMTAKSSCTNRRLRPSALCRRDCWFDPSRTDVDRIVLSVSFARSFSPKSGWSSSDHVSIPFKWAGFKRFYFTGKQCTSDVQLSRSVRRLMSSLPNFETLKLSQPKPYVTLVELNRPTKLNAMNKQSFEYEITGVSLTQSVL